MTVDRFIAITDTVSDKDSYTIIQSAVDMGMRGEDLNHIIDSVIDAPHSALRKAAIAIKQQHHTDRLIGDVWKELTSILDV